jgi:hypothetical protein
MAWTEDDGVDPVRDAVAYARAVTARDSLAARRLLRRLPDPETLVPLLAVMLGAEVRTVARVTAVPEDETWDRLATTCDWLG